MEGQGPEHSSARIERFLQAVDDQEDTVPNMAEDTRMQIQHTNMQVVNCTTPANYFHVLRRQVHRAFRKPLVVAAPKSLLRHKSAVSSLKDMAEGTSFQRLIGDKGELVAPGKVRKLLLCSGKVYYDLEKARAELGAKGKDVAIVRVEQIAPFPFDLVAAEMARYPNASVTFVQEEPRNMGAWTYVAPRIATAARVLNKKALYPVRLGALFFAGATCFPRRAKGPAFRSPPPPFHTPHTTCARAGVRGAPGCGVARGGVPQGARRGGEEAVRGRLRVNSA